MRSTRTVSRLAQIAVALCALSVAAVRSTRADNAPATCSAGIAGEAPAIVPSCTPQVWLVSTRHVCGNCLRVGVEPKVWLNTCGGWLPSSVEDFLASDDPNSITVVLVHGNRIDSQEAVEQGMGAYRAAALGSPCGPCVRYVIWSWPSDPVPGGLTYDAEVKAARTDAEGYYLASFLARIAPDVRIELIGFSFGARISAAALHLMAGGTVNCRALDPPAPERTAHPRVALMAAAVDCDWLMPGRRYGYALYYVERMLVTINPKDMVLKHYPRITDRDNVEAIGLTGVAGASSLGSNLAKIDQRIVSDAVGHWHAFTHYIEEPSMMGLVRREILMYQPAQALETARAPR